MPDAPRPGLKCPVCHSEMPGPAAEWPSLPFCSPRCKVIDLGRWLGEKYRLPGSGKPDPDEPDLGGEEGSRPDRVDP